MLTHPQSAPPAHSALLTPSLLATLTVAAGVAVANIYYNQPMLSAMARSLDVNARQIGFVATATQIGYAAGMPLFIPLGDLRERRGLVVSLFLCVGCALVAAALAPNLASLVAASFLIGLTTVIAQIVIPLAAELAEPGAQGRTIGTIMTGVLLGILLARTLSGLVSAHFGWRSMFWMAAALAWLFALLLRWRLPRLPPHAPTSYRVLLRSLWNLACRNPKLLEISSIAALFFAAFGAFWTTLVFLLERPPYHLGSQTAGLFGLVGALSALVAPAAGRLSDRHSPLYVVHIAAAGMLAAFAVLWGLGSHLWGLVIGVILLDAAAAAAQVANQSRILALQPQARSRSNTIYMIFYFGGGSLGSFIGSWAWAKWHWSGVCLTGITCMLVASLLLLVTRPAAQGLPASA